MREDSGTRGPEIRRGGTNGVHFDHCSPHRTPIRGFYAPGNRYQFSFHSLSIRRPFGSKIVNSHKKPRFQTWHFMERNGHTPLQQPDAQNVLPDGPCGHCSPHGALKRCFFGPGNHNKNASGAINSVSIHCPFSVHSRPKSSIQTKTAFPDLTFRGTWGQRSVPELPFYKIRMRRVTARSVFPNRLGDIFRGRVWQCLLEFYQTGVWHSPARGVTHAL